MLDRDGSARTRIVEFEGGDATMKVVKPQTPSKQAADKPKRSFGIPGSAKERRSRIRSAIEANRETLRRLAK